MGNGIQRGRRTGERTALAMTAFVTIGTAPVSATVHPARTALAVSP